MSGEIEYGYCSTCGTQGHVVRTYYRYDLDCECCGGNYHLYIVWHCPTCEPKEPLTVRPTLLTSKLKNVE